MFALTNIKTEGISTNFIMKWGSPTDFLRVFLKAEAVCDPWECGVWRWGRGLPGFWTWFCHDLAVTLDPLHTKPQGGHISSESVCRPREEGEGQGEELGCGAAPALYPHLHIHRCICPPATWEVTYWLFLSADKSPRLREAQAHTLLTQNCKKRQYLFNTF